MINLNKITYNSGPRTTQIDYWLVRRRDLNLVTDVKVIPSVFLNPQRRPLIMDIRISLPRKAKPRLTGHERIKWWKISEPAAKEQLTRALSGLNGVYIHDAPTVESLWTRMSEKIHNDAAEVLRATKPERRNIDKQTW